MRRPRSAHRRHPSLCRIFKFKFGLVPAAAIAFRMARSSRGPASITAFTFRLPLSPSRRRYGGTAAIQGFLWLPLGPSFAGHEPADRPESRWPGPFRVCDRRGPGPTLTTGRAFSVATAEGAFHRRHIVCSCDKQKLRTRLRVRQLENSPAQIICLQIPLSGKFNLCSRGHGGKVRRRSVVTADISGRWRHRELGPGRWTRTRRASRGREWLGEDSEEREGNSGAWSVCEAKKT